jgi:hypothetical protein
MSNSPTMRSGTCSEAGTDIGAQRISVDRVAYVLRKNAAQKKGCEPG